MSRILRCFRRARLGVLTVLTVTAATSALTLATAKAATASPTSAGDWFPLRGDHLIGCTKNGVGGACNGSYHPYWALDIKASIGEPVYAAGAGKVVSAVKDQGGNCDARTRALSSCTRAERGNSVLIEHGGGNYTYYQHLKDVTVNNGDAVTQDTSIGTIGISGWTYPTFPHLHFERRSAPGSAENLKIDPGKLKGCVGSTLKTYPDDLLPSPGATTWYGLRSEKYTARSAGTSCVAPGSGSAGSGKPKVDLVFVVDTTGSMGPYIDGVKSSANALATSLFNKADARVALVDYKDLYAGCPSDGYAARVDLPFSTSASAFSAALSPLTAAGGCDTPESVYSGLMAGIQMPWRSGVAKALIVMGDAPPHDPEPVTGFTRTSVAAAAFAVDPATIYSINIGGGASPYFEGLASDSGGKSYIATDPSSAVDQIGTAITTITQSVVAASTGGPYAGVVGSSITFNASSSVVPAGAAIVSYEWDFNGDGKYDQTTTSPIVTNTYSAPYKGAVGVRITTDQVPAQTATATGEVVVFEPTVLKITGQRSGRPGQMVHLQSLLSTRQGRPVSGVEVQMSIGAASCSASTDVKGRAACDLKVPTADAAGGKIMADSTESWPYFASAANAKFKLLSPTDRDDSQKDTDPKDPSDRGDQQQGDGVSSEAPGQPRWNG